MVIGGKKYFGHFGSAPPTDKLIDELTSKVLAYVERDLATIHKVTGLEQFVMVVHGHFPSSPINEWDECSSLDGIERLELAANDLDVYHGPFTAEEEHSYGSEST